MAIKPELRRGFTLIELLVVVSIISLLVSILLPSIQKARVQARNTQCLTRLRSLFIAHSLYVQDYGRFSDLNNDLDDGAWQYNYLIFDGRDLENGFGPVIGDGRSLDHIKGLFCPVQKDPYHRIATPQNPWPPVRLLDTRAGYARRYHLSGKAISDMRGNPAFAADVLHLPDVIKSAHKKGVNAVYFDGHAKWVPDTGLLTDNRLSHPFSRLDNPEMEDIWDLIDAGG